MEGRDGVGIGALSDDLLAHVFSLLDSTQLRTAAGTCRRWAALLRERRELWREVAIGLPPKRSRGRDRRNSYTTPCALNLPRLTAWLLHRAAAIQSLDVRLLYPDALCLLGQLLPPLAPALRRLVLRGSCHDWPFMWVDWRWLAGMTQLESLDVLNALPGLAELLLPPSLTQLHVDRVGGGDPEIEGWDELPPCFTQLSRLQKLTLGTAATYLLQADEESAYTPLQAAVGLRELHLPKGALTAVPDALTALTGLTMLSFRGCDRLEAFGNMCQHKGDPFLPLACLRRLRCLDFSCCALQQLPANLILLSELRTLLLADNQLTRLPNLSRASAAAAAAAAAAGAGSSSGGGGGGGSGAAPPLVPASLAANAGANATEAAAAAAAAGAAAPLALGLPAQLEHLDLSGNRFSSLPTHELLRAVGQLTHLDLSCCWKLQPTPAEWWQLLAGLPRLRLLRHSCPLLAAEPLGAQGSSGGGAAAWAAAVGGSADLQLEYLPSAASCQQHPGQASGRGAGGSQDPTAAAANVVAAAAGSAARDGAPASGGSKRSRSCSSLADLETAAATLLSGGGGGGHATLADLAATASSGAGSRGELVHGCGS